LLYIYMLLSAWKYKEMKWVGISIQVYMLLVDAEWTTGIT